MLHMILIVIGALLVTFALLLALGGWLLRSRARPGSRQDYETLERARMPPELAEGRLVINEQTLWRRGERPIVAKTDQVFLTPDGWLVPVETKTRGFIAASDIAQLSVQAVVLAAQRGSPPVASWGYLRLAQRGRKPVYRRVRLLNSDQVELLWDRWTALRRGATPIARPAQYRCRHCALRTRCPDRILAGETANRRSRGRG